MGRTRTKNSSSVCVLEGRGTGQGQAGDGLRAGSGRIGGQHQVEAGRHLQMEGQTGGPGLGAGGSVGQLPEGPQRWEVGVKLGGELHGHDAR